MFHTWLDCSIRYSIWFAKYHKCKLLLTGKYEIISVSFTGVCNVFFCTWCQYIKANTINNLSKDVLVKNFLFKCLNIIKFKHSALLRKRSQHHVSSSFLLVNITPVWKQYKEFLSFCSSFTSFSTGSSCWMDNRSSCWMDNRMLA